eukprot:g592.t1
MNEETRPRLSSADTVDSFMASIKREAEALPVDMMTRLSNNFDAAYKRVRCQRNPDQVFASLDKDGNGTIDEGEFRQFMTLAGGDEEETTFYSAEELSLFFKIMSSTDPADGMSRNEFVSLTELAPQLESNRETVLSAISHRQHEDSRIMNSDEGIIGERFFIVSVLEMSHPVERTLDSDCHFTTCCQFTKPERRRNEHRKERYNSLRNWRSHYNTEVVYEPFRKDDRVVVVDSDDRSWLKKEGTVSGFDGDGAIVVLFDSGAQRSFRLSDLELVQRLEDGSVRRDGVVECYIGVWMTIGVSTEPLGYARVTMPLGARTSTPHQAYVKLHKLKRSCPAVPLDEYTGDDDDIRATLESSKQKMFAANRKSGTTLHVRRNGRRLSLPPIPETDDFASEDGYVCVRGMFYDPSFSVRAEMDRIEREHTLKVHIERLYEQRENVAKLLRRQQELFESRIRDARKRNREAENEIASNKRKLEEDRRRIRELDARVKDMIAVRDAAANSTVAEATGSKIVSRDRTDELLARLSRDEKNIEKLSSRIEQMETELRNVATTESSNDSDIRGLLPLGDHEDAVVNHLDEKEAHRRAAAADAEVKTLTRAQLLSIRKNAKMSNEVKVAAARAKRAALEAQSIAVAKKDAEREASRITSELKDAEAKAIRERAMANNIALVNARRRFCAVCGRECVACRREETDASESMHHPVDNASPMSSHDGPSHFVTSEIPTAKYDESHGPSEHVLRPTPPPPPSTPPPPPPLPSSSPSVDIEILQQKLEDLQRWRRSMAEKRSHEDDDLYELVSNLRSENVALRKELEYIRNHQARENGNMSSSSSTAAAAKVDRYDSENAFTKRFDNSERSTRREHVKTDPDEFVRSTERAISEKSGESNDSVSIDSVGSSTKDASFVGIDGVLNDIDAQASTLKSVESEIGVLRDLVESSERNAPVTPIDNGSVNASEGGEHSSKEEERVSSDSDRSKERTSSRENVRSNVKTPKRKSLFLSRFDSRRLLLSSSSSEDPSTPPVPSTAPPKPPETVSQTKITDVISEVSSDDATAPPTPPELVSRVTRVHTAKKESSDAQQLSSPKGNETVSVSDRRTLFRIFCAYANVEQGDAMSYDHWLDFLGDCMIIARHSSESDETSFPLSRNEAGLEYVRATAGSSRGQIGGMRSFSEFLDALIHLNTKLDTKQEDSIIERRDSIAKTMEKLRLSGDPTRAFDPPFNVMSWNRFLHAYILPPHRAKRWPEIPIDHLQGGEVGSLQTTFEAPLLRSVFEYFSTNGSMRKDEWALLCEEMNFIGLLPRPALVWAFLHTSSYSLPPARGVPSISAAKFWGLLLRTTVIMCYVDTVPDHHITVADNCETAVSINAKMIARRLRSILLMLYVSIQQKDSGRVGQKPFAHRLWRRIEIFRHLRKEATRVRPTTRLDVLPKLASKFTAAFERDWRMSDFGDHGLYAALKRFHEKCAAGAATTASKQSA